METFWQKFKRWSHTVGDFQARLILTFLYAVLVLPTGLIARIGGDLLEKKRAESGSYWQQRAVANESVRDARGQS